MSTKKIEHKIAHMGVVAKRLGVFLADPGEAYDGKLAIMTNLSGTHYGPDGKVIRTYNWGSGLITLVAVNTMVSDAVTGTSVVPFWARMKYMDSGTGTTAATDGDTVLGAAAGPARVVATLSNGQTATAGNHLAKLNYVGTIAYTSSLAITEWGLFDAASVGNLADRKVFAAVNVSNGDSIQYTYVLSLPSNN